MSIASDEAAIRKVTQDWIPAIGDKNAAAMSRFSTEDVVCIATKAWRNTRCGPTFDLREYIPRLRAEGGSNESLNHADRNAHCDRPGKRQR
jgi:hypothetical protein